MCDPERVPAPAVSHCRPMPCTESSPSRPVGTYVARDLLSFTVSRQERAVGWDVQPTRLSRRAAGGRRDCGQWTVRAPTEEALGGPQQQ